MDEATERVVAASDSFADLSPEAAAALAAALRRRVLRSGDVLFRSGAGADGMVVVEWGSLGVLDEAGQVVAGFGRGELLGEMGALTGEVRSRTVVALRDSSVLEISQKDFDRVFDSSPGVGRSLARLVVSRLRSEQDHAGRRKSIPKTVAIVTSGSCDTDRLVSALSSITRSATVITDEIEDGRNETELLTALGGVEARNDLVLLLAGEIGVAARSDWRDWCLRQADAIVVAVEAGRPASTQAAAALGRRLSGIHATRELVIVDPAGSVLGWNAASWVAQLAPARLHHVRVGDDASSARFARLVLGRGVGLVLSGGAAKGLAHLGAWRAIRELDIAIDSVAGVSFGALLGAGIALDYTPAELRDEVEQRLVGERGLVDLTLPWLALLRGRGISRRIEDVAEGRAFEQTWRSFVCTSCDLSSGEIVEHRSGPLWRAIRASVSIPGVLPPVRVGPQLLVDGAVRDNLPVASLRAGHPTPLRVIAIDVGKDGVLAPGNTPSGGQVSGWKLAARRIDPRRSGPDVPMMSQVLMRVMELAGGEPGPPDVVVRPDLHRLGLGAFELIDEFERAGYEATVRALS